MNQVQIGWIKETKAKIIEKHNNIIGSLKRTVNDAIEIGKLLSEAKERLNHGEFMPWVGGLPFSRKSCDNYIKIYKHSDKMVNVTNLQEAYNEINQIESKKKQEKLIEQNKMIHERMKTGVKPEGWDRSTDYEYKKRIDKDAFNERMEKAFKKKEPHESINIFDEVRKILDKQSNEMKEQEEIKTKARLSGNNKESYIFNLINEYLLKVQSNSEKLEACHNIIKYCKSIANSLQIESIST